MLPKFCKSRYNGGWNIDFFLNNFHYYIFWVRNLCFLSRFSKINYKKPRLTSFPCHHIPFLRTKPVTYIKILISLSLPKSFKEKIFSATNSYKTRHSKLFKLDFWRFFHSVQLCRFNIAKDEKVPILDIVLFSADNGNATVVSNA